MLSMLSKDDLLLTGSHFRIGHVLAQGRYTLGLVQHDPDVARVLGPPFASELQGELSALELAMKDRDVAEADATAGYVVRGDTIAHAKVWRRSIANLAQIAVVRGLPVSKDLTHFASTGRDAEKLARDLDRMVGLAAPALGSLAQVGVTQKTLDDGTALAKSLGDTTRDAQLKRLNALPAKVRDAWMHAALVYYGCKQVNAAGHGVHAADHAASAQFNFDLLHRHGRRQAAAANAVATAPLAKTA